jgi:hypothetical protein
MIGSIRFCLVSLSLGFSLVMGVITPAAANTITYNWFGIVDTIAPGTTPGVADGDTFRISLTLSDAVPDGNPSPEIGYYLAFMGGPNDLVLAVDVGGRTNIGLYQEATVQNDHNGKDTFSINTASPLIGFLFQFDFSTSDLGVFNSDALPLSLIPEHFDSARFTLFQHGGPPLFSGRLVTTTPLPGSIGLLVSGLLSLVGAGWWKSRRKVVSQTI